MLTAPPSRAFMSADRPLTHLYLHFPFCTGRCGYCAFTSGPPTSDPVNYIHALVAERDARQLHLAPLKSLYCGGGTPGLIGSEGFYALKQSGLFTFSANYEWTVELHPATVTPALMQTLVDCGVTRISIGVQSFNDDVLRQCNRRHTAQQALEAIRTARAFIPDTGIDLIAGLPGINDTLWRATLDQCLALDLPHVSIYALSIDEGSNWAREGRTPPNGDAVCDAIAEAAERLAAVGLARYETSNYARSGCRCQHNLNTWHGGDYVGLGKGAASRIGLTRRAGNGTEERLSTLEDALERALTQLRLDEGFDLAQCLSHYPMLTPYAAAWENLLTTYRENHLLSTINAPTLRGYEVLDAMERSLLEATL